MRARLSIALFLCFQSVCVAQQHNEQDPVPPYQMALPFFPPPPTRGVDACAALNEIEVWAALRGHDGIASTRNESFDKKVSSCLLKAISADGIHDATALRAASVPEIVLIVSDTGGPALVDPRAVEPTIPDLGDHATIVAGPMPNDPSARKAFRVWVTTPSRSYALIYLPEVMNQESRNVAVQLAREVLLGDFRGHLDSYPLAEQLIAMDKMAVIQKPDDLAVWNEIGLFSQYLQRYDAARDAYLRISQVLPNDPGGFLGVAAADLAKADSENSALLNKRGLLPTSDIALKPEYTEVCGTLKQKTRNILDDGYTYAKRATQLRPEDDFSYWILSLLAQRKAWTDCGDTVAAEADGAEGVQLATLSGEKSKAAIGRRESHIRKVAVALGPPPHLAGPIGAIGGIVTQPAASMQVWGPVSVSVASGIQAGLLVSKVDPIYPQLARQARIQGSVILAAQIGKEGEIEDLQLISGHPMLVPAAIDAVKQWKYKPYVLNGTPVGVRTQIEVNFILSQQ